MNNVPPSVRAALKRRGQDAILQQEGDYQTFKPQIDAILHSDENINMSDDVMIPDYEEDLSPEEQKATDRIEELGGKYKSEDTDFTDEEIEMLNSEEGRKLESQGLTDGEIIEKLKEGPKKYDNWKSYFSGDVIEDYGNRAIVQLDSGEYVLWSKTNNRPISSLDKNNELIPMKYGSLDELKKDEKLKSFLPEDKTPAGMPPFHLEQPDDPEKEPHIVIDEGPHKGERYDNPDDYKNSNKPDDELENIRKSNPGSQFERMSDGIYEKTPTVGGRKNGQDIIEGYTYTPVIQNPEDKRKEYFIGKNNKRYRNFKDYANEIGYGAEQGPYQDFGDLRYYPVSDEDRKKAGPKYLGRYHSIRDAFGLSDWYRGETEEEPINGASVVRLPDGYYSINPNITQLSFKTREALKDYLDNEYKDYNTIERYQDDYPVYRTGRDEKTGKEYDYEPVDRYLEVQKQRQADSDKPKWSNEELDEAIDKHDLNGLTPEFKDALLKRLMERLNNRGK